MPAVSGIRWAGPLISSALAVSLCTVSVTYAVAVPADVSTPEIEAVRAELGSAQEELARMADEQSLLVEEYNTVAEALDETRDRVVVAEVELEAAREDVSGAEILAGRRVAEMYKRGDAALIEVLLGTTSFRDFLVRLDLCTRVSEQDAQVIDALRAAKDRMSAVRDELDVREEEQSALKDSLESQRIRIERSVAQQEAYVDSLDQDVRELIAEEEERQRRVEEERARQAAEALARQLAEQQAMGGGSVVSVDLDGPGRAEVGVCFLGASGGSVPFCSLSYMVCRGSVPFCPIRI